MRGEKTQMIYISFILVIIGAFGMGMLFGRYKERFRAETGLLTIFICNHKMLSESLALGNKDAMEMAAAISVSLRNTPITFYMQALIGNGVDLPSYIKRLEKISYERGKENKSAIQN